eukprot:1775412-Pyramimonas_sp.AAC.1
MSVNSSKVVAHPSPWRMVCSVAIPGAQREEPLSPVKVHLEPQLPKREPSSDSSLQKPAKLN